MPTLLRLEGADKSYGALRLLDNADLALTDTMKVGVVGRNGSGKSTLCRVLIGDEALDGGALHLHPDLRLGYLRQHDPWQEDDTVLAFLERDSGLPEWRCGQIAARFDLSGERLTAPLGRLSGGWRTRVKLSALLLHDPNLLILDEPTNFLDLRTQMLLEGFLADWRGACLLVSHDRNFLRATCDHTLAVERGRLELVPGDIDAWCERRVTERRHAQRVNAGVEAKRRQLQRFVDTNRAKARRASQAKNKVKQIERLETIAIADEERQAMIRLPAVEARTGPALICQDLAIGYGPQARVASDINLEIEHGRHVAVVGDNGEGKTTLLRTIAGSLDPLGGRMRWGHGCRIGLYAQQVYAALGNDGTVYDHLLASATPDVTSQDIRNLAGGFLFHGDDIHQPIATLSGGERARLVLAGLLLGGYSVLVLDEPSNHLDVETVAALAQALQDYAGTVIFASHDRTFVSHLADAVIEVGSGRAKHYPGDYATYCYRMRREIDDGQRAHAAQQTAAPAQRSRSAGRRRFELEKHSAAAERSVAKLEQDLAALEAEMLAAGHDPQRLLELDAKRVRLEQALAEAETAWCEAQQQLDELDQ